MARKAASEIKSGPPRRAMVRLPHPRRETVLWAMLIVAVIVAGTLTAVPSSATARPLAPLASGFSDDFTRDTSLNTTLWQVNGPVGSAFAGVNCPGCTIVPIAPGFSPLGMEVAAANGSSEIGTIQSTQAIAPPFTVSVLVEGTISDGHPFVFGISTADATSGVQITGNLNPNDCSAEKNCGDPTTCGTPPVNSTIGAGQCFYGIYARVGSGSGNWVKTPSLDLTPSVGVVYTLQISVDTSGTTQYNVSQGGVVLGQSSAQVGVGPFYVILGQSEGSPVPGPGPNEAYWMSASMTPSAPSPTSSSSSSSPSGLSEFDWVLIVVVAVIVLACVVLVAGRRRRELTVAVLDSETMAPLSGAGVSADGPKSLSGQTGPNGRIAFGGVRAGDYSVRAEKVGYRSSAPVPVSVGKVATHTVRLDRMPPSSPAAPPPHSPAEVATPVAPPPPTEAGPSPPPKAVPSAPAGETVTSPSRPGEMEESEGFGGERIRRIIETFETKGALSPDTALTAEELGLSRLFVRVMKRRRGKTRVFVEVNGRYYLDEKALREMK